MADTGSEMATMTAAEAAVGYRLARDEVLEEAFVLASAVEHATPAGLSTSALQAAEVRLAALRLEIDVYGAAIAAVDRVLADEAEIEAEAA